MSTGRLLKISFVDLILIYFSIFISSNSHFGILPFGKFHGRFSCEKTFRAKKCNVYACEILSNRNFFLRLNRHQIHHSVNSLTNSLILFFDSGVVSSTRSKICGESMNRKVLRSHFLKNSKILFESQYANEFWLSIRNSLCTGSTSFHPVLWQRNPLQFSGFWYHQVNDSKVKIP